MSLTPEQIKARDGKVTASFAPYLMAGNREKIYTEWLRLVGSPDYEPEDLSDSWPVQFGSYIEPFALDWHQRRTGRELTRRGEVVVHPDRPYVSCTLDAYRADDDTVIDCKAIGAWNTLDKVGAFYLPQMVVQRGCVGAQGAALLIVHGGAAPQEWATEIGHKYAALVWERVDEFWQTVLDLTPPVEMPAIAAPVPAVREYDLTGNNEWASFAADWIERRSAAKIFVKASEALKEMVPADAVRCIGHGIKIARNKAGSLTITETTP